MLSNEFYSKDNKVRTASIVIVSKDGFSLYIKEWRSSRKGGPKDKLELHLIGGKANEDEAPLDTGYREFKEEIGLDITRYSEQLRIVKICDYPLTGNFADYVNRIYYMYVNMDHDQILYPHEEEKNAMIFFGDYVEDVQYDKNVEEIVWLDNNLNIRKIYQMNYKPTSMFKDVYRDKYMNRR